MEMTDVLITFTVLTTVFIYPFFALWLSLFFPSPISAVVFLALHSPFVIFWYYRRRMFDMNWLEIRLHPSTTKSFDQAFTEYLSLLPRDALKRGDDNENNE